MTSYFKDGLRYIWPFKSKFSIFNSKKDPLQDPNYSEPIIQFLGPWESSMITLQSIFIWERPQRSAFALIAANLFYWYFALNNIQFFYGANIIGLILFVYHQWVYLIWPEICISSVKDQEDWTPVHPRVLSVPEVSRYVKGCLSYMCEQKCRLLQLRKKQPGLFSICVTFWFAMLGLLGQSLSGVNLVYLSLMLVMCGPGILIHAVPKSVYIQIRNAWSILNGKSFMNDSCSSLDSEVADFMPEESSEAAQIALIIPFMSDTTVDPETLTKQSKRRSNSSKKSKKGNTSGLTSFATGMSENDFPSLDNISDPEEDEDLSLSEVIEELKPKQQQMDFVQSHFGDSSTDEEEFTEGLIFRDSSDGRRVVVNNPPSAAQAAVDKLIGAVAAEHAATLLTSIGQQLVSAMSTNVPHQTPTKDQIVSSSEEDEDFELISDDEL